MKPASQLDVKDKIKEQKKYRKYLMSSKPSDMKEAEKLIAALRESNRSYDAAYKGQLAHVKELELRDLEHLETIRKLTK